MVSQPHKSQSNGRYVDWLPEAEFFLSADFSRYIRYFSVIGGVRYFPIPAKNFGLSRARHRGPKFTHAGPLTFPAYQNPKNPLAASAALVLLLPPNPQFPTLRRRRARRTCNLLLRPVPDAAALSETPTAASTRSSPRPPRARPRHPLHRHRLRLPGPAGLLHHRRLARRDREAPTTSRRRQGDCLCLMIPFSFFCGIESDFELLCIMIRDRLSAGWSPSGGSASGRTR
jgi:hypothetical protein